MSQKFKITLFSLATLPPAVKSFQVEKLELEEGKSILLWTYWCWGGDDHMCCLV